jgi:hypothetical protein
MPLEDYYRIPTVRVRRDGGKGYRIINRGEFDPSVHELVDDGATPPAERPTEQQHEAPVLAKRRRGRPRKNHLENLNAHR